MSEEIIIVPPNPTPVQNTFSAREGSSPGAVNPIPVPPVFTVPNKLVGINLAPIYPYTKEQYFTNWMKQSSVFGEVSGDNDGVTFIGGGVAQVSQTLTYQNNEGYPTGLVSGTWALTRVMDHTGYKTGTYILKCEGDGTIFWNANGQGAQSGISSSAIPLRMSETILTPTQAVWNIWISSTSATNPIKNLKLYHSDDEFVVDTTIFSPQFINKLKTLKPVSIRFMDWMQTNFNKVTNWSFGTQSGQAKDPAYFTQSDITINLDEAQVLTDIRRGVSYNHIISLCNEIPSCKFAWICIPHKADDNFVTQIVTYLTTFLRRDIKLVIEYSNETWNTNFNHASDYSVGQYGYCTGNGAALGLEGLTSHEQGHQFYAKRAKEIFDLAVAAGTETRVIRVLANQLGDEYSFERRSKIGVTGSSITPIVANWYATNCYFGHNFHLTFPGSGWEDRGNYSAYAQYALNDLNRVMLAGQFGGQPGWRVGGAGLDVAMAAARGMKYVSYEAGQHISYAESVGGITGTVRTQNWHDWHAGASGHMSTIYNRFWKGMRQVGVTLACHYSDTTTYAGGYAWGLYGDPLNPTAYTKWNVTVADSNSSE